MLYGWNYTVGKVCLQRSDQLFLTFCKGKQQPRNYQSSTLALGGWSSSKVRYLERLDDHPFLGSSGASSLALGIFREAAHPPLLTHHRDYDPTQSSLENGSRLFVKTGPLETQQNLRESSLRRCLDTSTLFAP